MVGGVCNHTMACYHPLLAYRSTVDGAIFFRERVDCVQIELSCGQCVGCRLERSRQWATRCMHEASLYDANCFITLTYNNDSVPADGGLHYDHFQRFMKRLRKAFPSVAIRFFMCGEYGENYGRPHYHACLFNFDFPDRVIHSRTGSGFFIYTSAILGQLWPYGFSSVSDFSFETAAYVARYVMKKVTGFAGKRHYEVLDEMSGEIINRSPEFCRMSLRPGIGARWFEKYYHSDVAVRDKVVVRGHECTVPRYYDKLLKRNDPLQYDDVKCKRELDNYARRSDNTVTRLRDKEIVAKARVKFLKRTLR